LTPTEIRARLPRVFSALLGRFHRLTPVQEQGIPPILEGRDVLLSAPSASGKTEAYLAPLVERMLREAARDSWHILIVSPTRTLANDLRRRLEGPLSLLGVRLGRYTGEHKERRETALPEVTVTTPEALDSLLARRPYLLTGVQSLVLDEIHLLDGTPRGDQLRLLLHRLESQVRTPLQRVAASATIAAASELAGRYLQDPAVIEVAGTRRLYARGFVGANNAALATHLTDLAQHGFRKVLVFCNSRNAVERVADGLLHRTPFRDAVFPHHGSLSRGQRERTERRFLEAPVGVAVATLTLELGIDIGTVDYVLLVSVPTGVDSLLQRIGRGNRRTGMSRVGYVYASEGEKLLYHVLLEQAVQGDLCTPPYVFRPGVLAQQALVLAGSWGYITVPRLERVLPPAVRCELPPGTAQSLLERLVTAEFLEHAAGERYVLSERSERRYTAGHLHGNMESSGAMDVVDRLTGEVVGTVATHRDLGGDALRLGGHGRRPVATREGRIFTDVVAGGGPTRFARRGAPSMGFRLARPIARKLGAGEEEVPWGRSDDLYVLIHGLGTAGALLLSQRLAEALGKRRVLHITPIAAVLAVPPKNLPRPGPEEVAQVVRRQEQRLARSCGMGPYHRYLPAAVRQAAVRQAADLDAVAQFLACATLVQRPDAEVPPVWLEL
jgi:ATP-dependent Lhr-like helicase